jgi:outer membrane protein with beta-barrel domain
MRIAGSAIGITAAIVCFAASGAWAQPEEDRYGTTNEPIQGYDDSGTFSLRTGLGFTADPDTLLLGFEGEYAFNDYFSMGPMVQLGIDDDTTLVSPVLFARFKTDLGGIDPDLEPVEPYFQVGPGFTYWDIDAPPGRDDDDLEFLLNLGIGTEYRIDEHFSLGTQFGFNIIPTEIFDERFYFSWEVLTLRYRF